MSKEVFRSVNKYTDFSTGEDHYEFSKVYDSPGQAKTYATRLRHPSGKSNPTKKIGNRFNLVDEAYPNGYTFKKKEYTSFYEFVETWCERAKEWERV